MDRVTSCFSGDYPIAALRRFALTAAAAMLAAALCVWTPAFARQSLEIDGQLAPQVEDQLRKLAQDIASADAADFGSTATARHLLGLLRSEGYYGASIRTGRRENGVVFHVAPGLRFEIGDVEVHTYPDNPDAAAIALSASGLEIESPLRAEAVIAGEARALAALQEGGWPDSFAEERQVTVDHNTRQAQVILNIETGAFSRYGDVTIADPLWRPAFIRRLAQLEAGDPVQLSALRDYQSRLTNLQGTARAQVSLAEPQAGSDRRDVSVELMPAAHQVVEAGFSLSTSDGSGVDGAWTRRNLFGGDEAITVSAQLSTLEQSIGGQFTAPHWRRLNQTLTLIAGVLNEETDAFDKQEAAVGIDVTRRLSPVWSGGVQLGIDLSRLRTNGAQDDTATVALGLAAVYETRDSTTDPTRGARATVQVTPSVTFGDIQSGFVISDANLRSYRRLGDRLVAAGRIRLGGLIGASVDAVPADERFYAGGGGSVRGFDFQSLGPTTADGRPTGGRSVVEASAELRWRGPGRWGAAVFADAGMASERPTPDVADLRVGLGAGLRYHFDFAPVRLDVATPLDRRSGEASLHVYVGLGQAF